MSAQLTWRQLVETLETQLVETLDAAPYQQGAVSEPWHIQLFRYAGLEDPDTLAHLALAVGIENSPRYPQRPSPNGELWVESRILVTFSYRLRGDQDQRADELLAYDAQHEVIRTVMDTRSWAPGRAHIAEVVDALSFVPQPDQPYALVTSRFNILHRLEL